MTSFSDMEYAIRNAPTISKEQRDKIRGIAPHDALIITGLNEEQREAVIRIVEQLGGRWRMSDIQMLLLLAEAHVRDAYLDKMPSETPDNSYCALFYSFVPQIMEAIREQQSELQDLRKVAEATKGMDIDGIRAVAERLTTFGGKSWTSIWRDTGRRQKNIGAQLIAFCDALAEWESNQ